MVAASSSVVLTIFGSFVAVAAAMVEAALASFITAAAVVSIVFVGIVVTDAINGDSVVIIGVVHPAQIIAAVVIIDDASIVFAFVDIVVALGIVSRALPSETLSIFSSSSSRPSIS